MRQIFQSLSDGRTEVVDVPAPRVPAGHVLIETRASILSAGTERMLVEFGQANLLAKARQQPDRVKDVLNKVRTDGLEPTLSAVRDKLGEPIPLGYASSGVVAEIGAGVTDLQPGDAVVSNGPHAELTVVPRTLVAKIPTVNGEPLAFDQAALAPIGAIALQGIRLSGAALGETVVVIGLGLIGLLSVQLLRANGCDVIGIDPSRERLEMARDFGARTIDPRSSDPVAGVMSMTRDIGADAVIIAAATKTSDPVRQAAQMSRKRGRLVLVGVTGLELNRSDFYEKELSFQVSCSYGPGRYDVDYESGIDYPVGFVRWTAGRNFEAFLGQLEAGRLVLAPVITHKFDMSDAPKAYEALTSDGSALAIALEYPTRSQDAGARSPQRQTTVHVSSGGETSGRVRIGVIGAGGYTRRILLPAFQKAGIDFVSIASHGGASAALAARKFGFANATTDVESILGDDSIDAVLITTRHDTHADLTVRALQAGKHVYVEKPLAMNHEELDAIESCFEPSRPAPILHCGFNRRFSPHAARARRIVSQVAEPVAITMTVNAGSLPPDHWAHDPSIGGGRILGEACHFVDLAAFLTGSHAVNANAQFLDSSSRDSATLTMTYASGSIASINYLANGSPKVPKERIELFCGGRVVTIDNFRVTTHATASKSTRYRTRSQDKGHARSAQVFAKSVRGLMRPAYLPEELLGIMRVTVDLAG